MENADNTVAEEIKKVLETADNQIIIILIGPGNNGRDGLVAARYLHEWGANVNVYLCARRPTNDMDLEMVDELGIPCIEAAEDLNLDTLNELLSSATVVVDAIFGTGRLRPLRGMIVHILDNVKRAKRRNRALRIFAVDVPSGLDASTGVVDEATLNADYTIVVCMANLGLFNLAGGERVGKVRVANVGIPEEIEEETSSELMTDEWANMLLPERPLGANKGDFGKILIIAGSINYIGAAYLACSGAIRVGAGLATLATAGSLIPILASKLTEVTYLPLPESGRGTISPESTRIIAPRLSDYDVMLMGCGLGQNEAIDRFIRSMLFRLRTPLPPLVLDADALNILARIPNWWERLSEEAIVTPHPGEMERLNNVQVDKIQQDRMTAAISAAQQWNKIVVLKGAYTVVASPDGQVKVSPIANPGLASAGTGDVLAGVIAGLVAQRLSLFDAASLGVYLHAKAGEEVKAKLGDAGMIASDLLPVLPLVIKQMKKDNE